MTVKTERLALRTTEEQRRLLTAASKAEGRTVTDFVLSHATRAAEEVLADRRVFMLADEAWAAFDAALDRPARAVKGLRRLMTSTTALDE